MYSYMIGTKTRSAIIISVPQGYRNSVK